MIDFVNFVLLESQGYSDISEAMDIMRTYYSHLNGVTVYFDDGLWYIVQNKTYS